MMNHHRHRTPASAPDDKHLAALRLLKTAVVARHLRHLETAAERIMSVNNSRADDADGEDDDDGADLVVVMVDSHASSVSGPDDDVVVMEEEEDEDGVVRNVAESSSSGVYSMPSSSTATSSSKSSNKSSNKKNKPFQKTEKSSKSGFVSTWHKLISSKKSRSLPEEEFAKKLIDKDDLAVVVSKAKGEEGSSVQKPFLECKPSTASSKSSVSVLVHADSAHHPACEVKINLALWI
jgi:hypothetical protein